MIKCTTTIWNSLVLAVTLQIIIILAMFSNKELKRLPSLKAFNLFYHPTNIIIIIIIVIPFAEPVKVEL